MKKLFTLSLLLCISYALFSQVYDVVFDDNGEPYGVKIFDGTSFQKVKFDNPAQDGTYKVEYNGETQFFDFTRSNIENQDESSLEIYEAGVIPEGDLLRAFAFTPNGDILAVLYQHSANVYFYNSTSYELLEIVDVGSEPMDITLTNEKAYVCCYASNEVNVIQLNDYSVSNSFGVLQYPCQIEVSNDETMVYLGFYSFLDGSIAAYEVSSGEQIFLRTEPFIHQYGSNGPQGRVSLEFSKFTLSPDGEFIVAVNTSGQNPVIFDAQTGEVLKTFDWGGKLKGTGFSVTGDTLYLYSTMSPDSMSMHRIEASEFSVIDSILAAPYGTSMIGYTDLAINTDGTKVLSGGDNWNSQYYLFDFNTYDCQSLPDPAIFGPTRIYTSFDRKYAISQVFLRARLIDIETGEFLGETPKGIMVGLAGASSPNGPVMMLTDGLYFNVPVFVDEHFYAFDFSDPLNIEIDTVITSGDEPEADVTSTAVLSTDGDKIIAANALTENISIIDYETGHLDTLIYMENLDDVKTIPGTDYIIALGELASGIQIIDLEDYSVLVDLEVGNADNLYVTADGKTAYAFDIETSSIGKLSKIDLNGAGSNVVDELMVPFSNCGYLTVVGHSTGWTSPGISPDGQYMIFGGVNSSQESIVSIVDVDGMKIECTLPVAEMCIFDYAFTDDSKRVCVLTFSFDICIVYLDGADSYVESQITLDDGSFSAAYNEVDGLFYVLTKTNTLYKIDPASGTIVDQYLLDAPTSSYQIEIDESGLPVVRSGSTLIYNDQWFTLPGEALNFSYNEANDLFIIPIPGPDKICVFDPLITSIDSYPDKFDKETLSIFPNPARDRIQIALPGYQNSNATEHVSTTDQESIYIRIFDTHGRMLSQSTIANQEKLVEIDISGLHSGMHIAVLYSNGEPVASGKFIVQK